MAYPYDNENDNLLLQMLRPYARVVEPIYGAAEAGTSLLSSLGSMVAGAPLSGGDDQRYMDFMRDYTYEPRSQTGKSLMGMLGSAGEFATDTLKLPAVFPGMAQFNALTANPAAIASQTSRLAAQSGQAINAANPAMGAAIENAMARQGLINYAVPPSTTGAAQAANNAIKAGSKTASKAAARNQKKTSTATVFDDVTNYNQALELARKGAHLKQDSSGQYIGGPRTEGKFGMTVDSPQALAAMRRSADQQVGEGLYNAAWYDRARSAAEEAAGGQNTSASLFSRGGAAYSPQATPPTETNSFLKQHNAQVVTGEQLIPRTKGQAANLAKAYQADPLTGQFILSPQKIRLGKKTGPYADAKDPTIPSADLYKTASDIWHGRVMSYSDPGGKQFSRGFTPQEHGFLTGENLLLADRAQQKMDAGLLGTIPGASADFRMDPRSAQAATWGAGRERSYRAARDAEIAKFEKNTAKWERQMAKFESSGKQGKKPQKPVLKKVGKESDASIIERARAGIDDATKRNIASLTYEYAPGEAVIPGGSTASGMENFSRQMQAVQGNRDPYIDALQVYQMNTLDAPGEYINSLGLKENQQAFVARPLVGMENSSFTTASGKPARGGSQIDQAGRTLMDTVSSLRAVNDLQEGVGWNKFTPANSSMKAWEKTGVQFSPMVNAADGSVPAGVQMKGAKEALEAAGLDVVHVGDGLHAGKFAGDWDGKKIQEAVKQASKGLNGRFTAGRFESGLKEPPWSTGDGPRVEGTGQVARYLEDTLTNSGVQNLASRLDAANVPQMTAQQTNIINNFLKANNLTMPSDIAKLREIIGRVGFRGFLDYVQKNGHKGLPAVLPFGLMGQFESEQQQ